MPNTFKIYEDLQGSFNEQQAKTLTRVISNTIIDEANMVTKVEFNALKEIVDNLATAVKELAEAQKRTEARVEELAEAQKRTEARVEELAEAQKRTEVEIKKLTEGLNDLRVQVGGLAMAVGYGIEDKYMPFMKKFALNQYGAIILKVERKNIMYPNGAYDEVNLYLEGEIDGHKVYIIGESKAQPGKKDIDKFSLMLKRLAGYFNADVKGFMLGYNYAPNVEEYLVKKYPNIDFYKTYQIEEIANR
jgi:hypothetical protein